MNNIVKFLLVPVVTIVINNSTCYSLEIDNDGNIVNHNNQNISTIKYTDQAATWEQWTKCANFEPIDINGTEYKNIYDFCEEHKLSSLRYGIECFFTEIYNLAHQLIYNYDSYDDYIDDSFDLGDFSFLDSGMHYSHEYKTLKYSIEQWKKQNRIARGEEQIEYQFITEERNILEHYDVLANQLGLEYIVSNIRSFQEKLNPKKYLNSHDIDNIQCENVSINMMSGCYYIANQLVQLTHDIIYAINNKVNEYKNKKMSNEQLYKEFRNYLIDEITLPCFNTIKLALSLFIENDGFIIENLAKNIHHEKAQNIAEDFFKNLQRHWRTEFLLYTKCAFVYNFSNLGRELYNKNREIINKLNDSIDEINKNIGEVQYPGLQKCLLGLSKLKDEDCIIPEYVNVRNYSYYYGIEMMRYIVNSTKNENIVNMANNCLKQLLYEINKLVRGLEAGQYINIIYDIDPNIIQKYEREKGKLTKNLKSIILQVPNIEYLDDIKYLFNKYEIKLKENGTYDISSHNIERLLQ